jgi:hypothetical protein
MPLVNELGVPPKSKPEVKTDAAGGVNIGGEDGDNGFPDASTVLARNTVP